MNGITGGFHEFKKTKIAGFESEEFHYSNPRHIQAN
jgi:hypothetical protein